MILNEQILKESLKTFYRIAMEEVDGALDRILGLPDFGFPMWT